MSKKKTYRITRKKLNHKNQFHPSRALIEIKERHFIGKKQQPEEEVKYANIPSYAFGLIAPTLESTVAPVYTDEKTTTTVEEEISLESLTVQEPSEEEQIKAITSVIPPLERYTDELYDSVTSESIDILDSFQPSDEQLSIENSSDEIFVAAPKVAGREKKRTQADIDREIVEKFYSNQTPDNFRMIWDRFYYGVHSYACKIMGDWCRSDDAVQETFQKAWEKRAQYNAEKSVYSTWLYAICRNVCFSELKKQNNDIISVDVNEVFYSTMYASNTSYARNDEVYYMTESDGSISGNTYDDISRKLYDASLNEISQMDPLFAQIFEMKNSRDMTLKEIAHTLDLKESRVKNVYYKNKEILAERIRTKYDDLCVTYRDAKHDRDEAEM